MDIWLFSLFFSVNTWVPKTFFIFWVVLGQQVGKRIWTFQWFFFLNEKCQSRRVEISKTANYQTDGEPHWSTLAVSPKDKRATSLAQNVSAFLLVLLRSHLCWFPVKISSFLFFFLFPLFFGVCVWGGSKLLYPSLAIAWAHWSLV